MNRSVCLQCTSRTCSGLIHNQYLSDSVGDYDGTNRFKFNAAMRTDDLIWCKMRAVDTLLNFQPDARSSETSSKKIETQEWEQSGRVVDRTARDN